MQQFLGQVNRIAAFSAAKAVKTPFPIIKRQAGRLIRMPRAVCLIPSEDLNPAISGSYICNIHGFFYNFKVRQQYANLLPNHFLESNQAARSSRRSASGYRILKACF